MPRRIIPIRLLLLLDLLSSLNQNLLVLHLLLLDSHDQLTLHLSEYVLLPGQLILISVVHRFQILHFLINQVFDYLDVIALLTGQL